MQQRMRNDVTFPRIEIACGAGIRSDDDVEAERHGITRCTGNAGMGHQP